MNVYASLALAAASKTLRGAALCLGNFDGVHLGHQALFAKAKAHGPAAVVTFQPHPGKVLQPQLAPKLICSPARKLELLSQSGLSAVVTQPFSLEYAKTTAEQFEAALFDELQAGLVVVGYDFTYGAKRAGSVDSLSAAARARGAQVAVVPAVTIDGVVVSSSKVREYILEGRVAAARRLLGRHFDLDGTVVRGAGRGRTIGFPTANIDTANELRPAPGVYAVRVHASGAGGGPYGGAANIGVKPTFGGNEVTIEAHLFEFSGELYGQTLRVEFIDRLRSEQRFASAAELSVQIARDVAAAKAALARA